MMNQRATTMAFALLLVALALVLLGIGVGQYRLRQCGARRG
jgi:hypothetical protein